MWITNFAFPPLELKVEIDSKLAAQSLEAALAESPQFAQFQPQLTWRPLAQGGAFFLQYGNQPPAAFAGLWEFQNAVVKGYKRMSGI